MAVKGVKKASKKQEQGVAKALEGKTVIASGALWQSKADVRTDMFLVECKMTEKDSYTLKQSIVAKIVKEAIKDSIRNPLLAIQIAKKNFIMFRVRDCIVKDSDVWKFFGVSFCDMLLRRSSKNLCLKTNLKLLASGKEKAKAFSITNHTVNPDTWFLVTEETFLDNKKFLFGG